MDISLTHSDARKEEGQGLVEYGLILALITILGIATLNQLGLVTNDFINKAATTLTTVS